MKSKGQKGFCPSALFAFEAGIGDGFPVVPNFHFGGHAKGVPIFSVGQEPDPPNDDVSGKFGGHASRRADFLGQGFIPCR